LYPDADQSSGAPHKTAKAHQTFGDRDLRAVEVRLSWPPLLPWNREAPIVSPVGLTQRTIRGALVRVIVAVAVLRSIQLEAWGRYSQARKKKWGLQRLSQTGPKRLYCYNNSPNGLDYLVTGVGECRLFRLVRQDWRPCDLDTCGPQLFTHLQTVWKGG
jgi:hypothetical protein